MTFRYVYFNLEMYESCETKLLANPELIHMIPSTFQVHNNMRDVALFVISTEKTDKGLRVICKWYNILYKGFCTDKTDTVTIKYEDLHNWREYNEK